MTTIHGLADQLYSAFETKTRDNGESYVVFKDGSPEWMTELAHTAHGDMMPDDFRYNLIREAAGAISDAGEDADHDETGSEFSDGVDVYNNALAAWAASHSYRFAYCDDALSEYGKPDSLSELLQRGQALERREVFDAVLSFLEGMAEDDE